MSDGLMSLARANGTMQHHVQAGIDAMVREPNPQMGRIALNLQNRLGDAQLKLVAPSRDELLARGYDVSPSEFPGDSNPLGDLGPLLGI